MLLARRKFVQSSLIFTAATVLFTNAPSALARTLINDGTLSNDVLGDPLYRFTRETFEPYVGGYFEGRGARGEMVPMKLLKVESYSPKPETKICGRTQATETFSLLFNAEDQLPQTTTIHPIKHGALGEFSLFLTRHDGARGEIFYEAVFNRVR